VQMCTVPAQLPNLLDRAIRIAPTFPELSEVAQAAEGVALCVQLAAAENFPKHFSKHAYRGTTSESAAGLQP